MAKKKKITLGKGLDGYQVAGKPISGKFIDHKYGLIDFYTMTAKQADRLIAAGMPYLKKEAAKRSSE